MFCMVISVPIGYPEIVRHPESRSIEQGATIALQCVVNGSLPLRVLWFKNNIPLNTTEDSRYQAQQSSPYGK